MGLWDVLRLNWICHGVTRSICLMAWFYFDDIHNVLAADIFAQNTQKTRCSRRRSALRGWVSVTAFTNANTCAVFYILYRHIEVCTVCSHLRHVASLELLASEQFFGFGGISQPAARIRLYRRRGPRDAPRRRDFFGASTPPKPSRSSWHGDSLSHITFPLSAPNSCVCVSVLRYVWNCFCVGGGNLVTNNSNEFWLAEKTSSL